MYGVKLLLLWSGGSTATTLLFDCYLRFLESVVVALV